MFVFGFYPGTSFCLEIPNQQNMRSSSIYTTISQRHNRNYKHCQPGPGLAGLDLTQTVQFLCKVQTWSFIFRGREMFFLFRYFNILIKQITIIIFSSPFLYFIRRLFVKLVVMVCSEDVDINALSFILPIQEMPVWTAGCPGRFPRSPGPLF